MAKLAILVLLVSMSVMNCRSYSLSKATPTPKGQDVGAPLVDSDQSILPSDRSGVLVWTCALCETTQRLTRNSACPIPSFKKGCPGACSDSWQQQRCDPEISDCANNRFRENCPCICDPVPK